MPQLVKGGKYVFGWSSINKDSKIRIPDETYNEYKFTEAAILIVISGSRTSGGFSISTIDTVEKSKFGNNILHRLGYSSGTDKLNISMLETIKFAGRLICWTTIDKSKYFRLSASFLKRLDINQEAKFLVVRGSGVGPGFVVKGRIFDEASKHDNIIGYF